MRTMRLGQAMALCLAILASTAAAGTSSTRVSVAEYPVPPRQAPRRRSPRDGGVWYTAQGSGELGWLDPKTGRTRHVALGSGSAPHGVIVGPDGAPWITDGGLNAIVRVDPKTRRVRRFPLPASTGYANLNTTVFDRRGVLWFTGQSGIYGRSTRASARCGSSRAPRGWPLRHHGDAVGRRLLRLPGGELPRPHRRRALHRASSSRPHAIRARGAPGPTRRVASG